MRVHLQNLESQERRRNDFQTLELEKVLVNKVKNRRREKIRAFDGSDAF